MIKKHLVSGLIRTVDTKELLGVYSECRDIINASRCVLNTYRDYKGEELDENDVLDEFSSIGVIEYSRVEAFSECRDSKLDVLNKYLARTLVSVRKLAKEVANVNRLCCIPDEDEFLQLKRVAVDCVSGMTYFLFYEFAQPSVLNENDVDEIMKLFADKKGISVQAELELLILFISVFKQKLDVFDAAPEKEAAFESVMGPYIVGVDNSTLTESMVDDVIEGRCTPESICSIDEEVFS